MKKIILSLTLISSVALANPQGIEIASIDKFNLSKSDKQKFMSANQEKSLNGFVNQDSDYPKYLMNVAKVEQSNLNNRSFLNDPQDTHIKKDLASIKLNFPFNGIGQNDVIGYAPIGAWDNGWSGIKTFFNAKDIGTCTYSVDTIVYVKLNKDVVSKDVNNKITSINVKGNKQDGFLYTVSWFEEKSNKDVIAKDLECANQNYLPGIKGKIIQLAKQIDKN